MFGKGLEELRLETIGVRWYGGTLRVTHEPMASAIVQSFLGHMHGACEASAMAQNLGMTTSAGHMKEVLFSMVLGIHAFSFPSQ